MNIVVKIAVIALLLISNSINSNAQKKIDPTQSSIIFSIGNTGADVEGKLHGLNGEIIFDETDLSVTKFSVNIPLKGLRSGNSMRDEHLHEAEFFDSKKYPSITFESTHIEKKDGYYLLTGDLGIKGISKSVVIQFIYEDDKFDGKLVLNRTAFNIGGEDYSDSIEENVKVHIRCTVK